MREIIFALLVKHDSRDIALRSFLYPTWRREYVFRKFQDRNSADSTAKIPRGRTPTRRDIFFPLSSETFAAGFRAFSVCAVYLATPHCCIFHCQPVYNKINSYS